MAFNRRQILQASAAGLAAFTAPLSFDFARAEDGFLEVTARPHKKKLYLEDAPASDIWTFNNTSPGPEIRVKKGERVRVRLINELEESTSIHWHGIRIANAMDGVSGLTQDPVPPGGSFDYDFVAPDAGTYWYHAHNKSWNQVARGLYGPLIIEEDEPIFDRDHDLTLVMDDWRLDRDGVFDTESLGSLRDWSHAGRLGNWLTVNGESLPKYALNAGQAYRLRLINAANARILEIDPGRFDAKVIAYDGQSLDKPEAAAPGALLIGPSQRVDLAVVPKPDQSFNIEEISSDQSFAFVAFDVNGSSRDSPLLPALAVNALPEPDIANARVLKLDMTGGAMGNFSDITYKGRKLATADIRATGQVWAFNGTANLAQDPMFAAKRGETIIIETSNDTAFAHAIHLHGHHFRILEQRDDDDDVELSPWRDTFLIGPDQNRRIAFVADNPGKWLLHCHMLEHAAAGMNTWFQVT